MMHTTEEWCKIASSGHLTELFDIPAEEWRKEIVDNIKLCPMDIYDAILRRAKPEHISKEKALQFLPYSRVVYKLLTEELKRDPDILEVMTPMIGGLPYEFFEVPEAVNHMLKAWNTDTSWALRSTDWPYFIFKPDISVPRYFVYPTNVYEPNISNCNISYMEGLEDAQTPREEAKAIMRYALKHMGMIGCVGFTDSPKKIENDSKN